MTIDEKNGWVHTIITECPDNPNLRRFWFGRLDMVRGEIHKIDAVDLGEAWRGLSAKLVEEQAGEAFTVCDDCNGRGWMHLSREDCQDCTGNGWQAV